MARLLTSPHSIDLVLGFTVLEAAILILWRWRRPLGGQTIRRLPRSPLRPSGIVVMLLPGISLMLALRAALGGAAWPWVPAALAAALVAHLADVRERWRD